MTNHMQVATIIKDQLRAGGLMKVMSWGARDWTAAPSCTDHLGALFFRVSGRKFKGIIEIALMPSDTYRVTLLKPWKSAPKGFKVVDTIEDVYCDVLTDVIDRRIET
jgi:hypothetical protein